MVSSYPSLLPFLLVGFVVVAANAAAAQPISGLGTTLPQLTVNSPYRVFNDLMKQSTAFVAYGIPSWSWIAGRAWGTTLTQRSDFYPAFLDYHIYAESDINFFPGIDDGLVNSSYEVAFDGNGSIGLYQNGSFNITVNTSQRGTIKIGSLTKLMVFVYFTDTTNPVGNIRILPVGGAPTFTSNFLKYAGNFNIYRFCQWQGESLNRLRQPFPALTWNMRVTPTSSSQVVAGIAYEHII